MSDSRWPDFLLVGAAKAGTTALYHQLGTHPDIFMSSQKEMHSLHLQPGDVPEVREDNSALDTFVNFIPQIKISVGINNFLTWYKSYYNYNDA